MVSGGNPQLDVEKSDSYTYGVLLQPRFIPGLTLSVDYYNIKVNNVITAPSAQGIINSCYDLANDRQPVLLALHSRSRGSDRCCR
ncbi:TonB-dependent receptor domain-containing protein [Sphingomonas aerolata]|uniref:TonB-dependent receptor domain-containing protein n=1 Tax=Sphingomonas aerolata TaxID=185951 RepID=UPI002FE3CE7F